MSGDGRSWTQDLLVYAHVGDLHIVDVTQQNYRDFLAIVGEIAAIGDGVLDFVFLPGDNADNGKDEQYDLVATGLRMLRVPVHAITGDHDMEGGSLESFYAGLRLKTLPYTQSVRGTDCVFLDMSGEGRGGPDFRLSTAQTQHLHNAIDTARAKGQRVAVFAHTYPADLVEAGERKTFNTLLTDDAVRIVDMGHTHYNEVANDGRTIFAATRSTGQIEEGDVGYSVTAIDGDAVSWRFKPLDESTPFVLITAPVDRRLRTAATRAEVADAIHAVVLGARGAVTCEWRGDDGDWRVMTPTPDGRGFEVHLDGAAAYDRIEVRATDAAGRVGSDKIEPKEGDARDLVADGSDRDTIGAWEGRHLLGTQLGPNRNGRKW